MHSPARVIARFTQPVGLRVVNRFKLAAFAEKPPAELRSIDSLIKTNGGLFKSPKQAAFLWRWANSYKTTNQRDLDFASAGNYKPHDIDQWGAKYAKGENAFTCLFVMRLAKSGHADVRRIRFYGYAYVIDGAGVAAAGKLTFKYEYDETKPSGFQFWPDGVKTTFVRTTEAPEAFDNSQSERERAIRIEQNRERINELKALAAFENEDAPGHQLIRSFVHQLESGKALSPAQLGILRKFVKDVNIGPQDEWVARRDAMFKLTEDKVIKPFLVGLQHGLQSIKSIVPHKTKAHDHQSVHQYVQTYHDEVQHEWAAFKRKPTKNVAVMGRLYQISNELIEHARFPKTQTAGLFMLLVSADQMASKGQKAPATALKNNWAIEKAKAWLEEAAPHRCQEIAQALAMSTTESLTEPDPYNFKV